MKIITLTKEKFDEYASKHPYRNHYQTSTYGNIMERHGYNTHYLGFIDDNNTLLGASLVLYKTYFMKYKYVYAPRGFLIDYNNPNLIKELGIHFKKMLSKQNFVLLKFDPLIICSKRDKKGNVIAYNKNINEIIASLNNAGFTHNGFNLYFENLKPRFKAIINLEKELPIIYKSFAKQIKNKISKAKRNGVEIYKEEGNNLFTIYEFIKRKYNRDIEYYQDFYNEFHQKGMCDIYYAKINPETCVENSKKAYEKELGYNNFLTNQIQSPNTKGIKQRKLINKKMESDKLVTIFKRNLVMATKLLQEYPNGLIIAGAIIIKVQKKAEIIIEAFDEQYKNFNPSYLLKWEIMKKLKEEEITELNLNAIVGEFEKENKYKGLNEMKLGFTNEATELIGEFTMILNPLIYKMSKIDNNMIKEITH